MPGQGVAAVSRHHVIFEIDRDGSWLVRAPDIKGCHSYGRSLSEARKNMREALSLFVAGDVQLVEERRLPRSARTAVTACRRAREQAEQAGEVAQNATISSARYLSRDVGLGIRDIAELLGISYQRVAQLLAGDAA